MPPVPLDTTPHCESQCRWLHDRAWRDAGGISRVLTPGVLGFDTHIILIPSPAGPSPSRSRTPNLGILFDPMDYVPIVAGQAFRTSLAGTGMAAVTPTGDTTGPRPKVPHHTNGPVTSSTQ